MFAASMALTGVAQADNCTDAPVSGGQYYIVNEGSGLQLDVLGWSGKDGASVVQWTNTSGQNQQWTVTNLGNGAWTIRPVHSGKSLDLSGFSTTEGASIAQWSYTGYTNQQWSISAAGAGAYKIGSNYSWQLLTVPDTKSGSGLQQRWDQTSAFQRWYFNPVNGKCSVSTSGSLTSFMGSKRLLIGAQMDDSTAASAPFDARYVYIASKPMPSDSCTQGCASLCSTAGWWGCWQDTSLLPGRYVADHIKKNASATWQGASRPRLSVFTYYVMKSAAGGEGSVELQAMNNADILKRYLSDWRFLLKTIGNERVMLQIEPDLWGFVRGANADPHAVPAQVRAANPTDCAWYEDSASGLARCMISMVRTYAPKASVGLHASPWNYAATGNAEETGRYMLALGAADGDFLTTDPSDRDAGWYAATYGIDAWWNDQKFATYLAWSKKLAETVGRPTVMWQLPLGNPAQNNTKNHWQDNKVEYVFSKVYDVAGSHVAALLFGAGEGDQTAPETDGGNLIGKTKDYIGKGGAGLR
ncbi:RICIN domain-containing protein [Ideonella sp. YS5]|uniref:RICIN domain-containing protein n=1 Tax=Ideonella sp. YS5 TaxID=3453714 RepID=UPI003F6F1A89